MFYETFLYLQFMFIICWRKEIVTKAACKMLVKLTTAVDVGGQAAGRGGVAVIVRGRRREPSSISGRSRSRRMG